MFTDLTFPGNNEEEFLRIAEKLGIKLIFCYPFRDFKPNSGIGTAVLAEPHEIDKIKGNPTILCNSGKREIFEYNLPLHIFGLENFARYDSMHSRHSGMNHTLAELAHKNLHTICFSVCALATQNSGFSVLLGRMMQNIKLCRKYKVKMKLATFAESPYQLRAAKEIESFGYFLGMGSAEVKNALDFN